ncbi:MFS transporter [Ruicaihuangia caeni]|uniref:MFS transporter n=1 Tax=Ruicaihuangia caeni TaxID=3042517 RepID=A0AAW6T9E2_9MICO|nr:MFS transporter [Klugiella sp. YN-L-19]MDI2098680.1 MFS transporter [Klugiella sp. YN-L-19]
MSAPVRTGGFPWPALLVLAGAIFSCTVSEFLPTGLLPDIARELNVSQAQVGLLVTIFAGTVVVSAAPLTALTRRYSRRALIVTVLLLFAASNLVAAIAPDYTVLVVARVIAGLAHGVFWAVAGAYPVQLVTGAQLNKAIAVTNMGSTAAFVMGVPLGTALGQALGWRLAFASVAVTVAVLAVLVRLLLPPVEHRVPLRTGEIAIPVRRDPTLPAVVVVCVLTLLIMLGQHSFYTYIAPWLIEVPALDAAAVPTVLLLYGLAGAVGLLLAGTIGRRYPSGTFVGAIIVAGGAIVSLALTASWQWPVFVLALVWGATMGLLPTLLQTRLLRVASPRVRDVSSAFLTTSFNVGIGTGALAGAAVLEAGGAIAVPWPAAVLLALSAVVAFITDRRVMRGALR